MVILTERLQVIADNIEIGESIADIGTDHGYLPLYLKEKAISPNVILTDVSKGSLAKAQENCKRLFPSEDIDLRLGDGLDVLLPGEVDVVVMAGIGGLLTTEMLDWDIAKSLSYKKYIFQPRNNIGALRRYLYEHGIETKKTLLAKEDRRYCEIIIAVPPKDYKGKIDSADIPQEEFEFSEEIIKGEGTYPKEYIEEKLTLERNILFNILAGRSREDDDPAVDLRENNIKRLEYLLSYANLPNS